MNKEKEFWSFPKYHGDGVTTTEITFNEKGSRIYRKCHVGKGDWWWKNRCRYKNNILGRNDPPDEKHPYCLIKKGYKKGEQGTISDYADNPNKNRDSYEWVPCTAQQCTIRQVYHLMFLRQIKLIYVFRMSINLFYEPTTLQNCCLYCSVSKSKVSSMISGCNKSPFLKNLFP